MLIHMKRLKIALVLFVFSILSLIGSIVVFDKSTNFVTPVADELVQVVEEKRENSGRLYKRLSSYP